MITVKCRWCDAPTHSEGTNRCERCLDLEAKITDNFDIATRIMHFLHDNRVIGTITFMNEQKQVLEIRKATQADLISMERDYISQLPVKVGFPKVLVRLMTWDHRFEFQDGGRHYITMGVKTV